MKTRWIPVLGSISIVALVIASPGYLNWLGTAFPSDWARIGSIGESYGFVSAMMSALAFIAVAWSIGLQARQMRVQRTEVYKSMHANLMKMVLDDPALLDCWQLVGDDVASKKRAIYLNIVYWWWFELYNVGKYNETDVRFEFSLFFKMQPPRDYYANHTIVRRLENHTPSERRFFDIADEEYAKALQYPPATNSSSATVDKKSEQVNLVARHGKATLLAAVLVGAGAGWAVRSSRNAHDI